MKKIFLFISLAILFVFAVSCNEDDVVKYDINLNFLVPVGSELKVEKINRIEFNNKDNGQKIVFEDALISEINSISLIAGQYDVAVQAEGKDENDKECELNGLQSSVPVSAAMKTLDIMLYPSLKGGFVIKELFYSGATNDKTGKAYQNGCDYIIIANNSDKVLYADSLVFAGTASNTAITSDIYREKLPSVYADYMFMIPGSGKDHPVQPGGQIVLCAEAKNHNEFSSKVPDLSKKANFEWFEPNPYFQLSDNPDVTNLEILFKVSRSISKIHIKGFTSIFIFKMPVSLEKLRSDYSNLTPFPNPSVEPVLRPLIPDTWISDAVELSSSATIGMKALPVSVDRTHTYCSEIRKGYTIQRKIKYEMKGRNVYLDTNSSEGDFERDKLSSLL